MNWRPLLGGSLRQIRRFKLRSFFMSIGVALGVATLIAGNTVSGGAEKQLTEQINQMFGPGTILVISRQLKPADLQAIADEMEQVVAFAPQVNLGEMEIGFTGETRQAAVAGYSENADFVWNRGVIEGRFFDASDVNRASRVALIGTVLKSELFGDGDPLGAEIMIGSALFEVIGVLDPIGIDPHGEDRDRDVYVPHTTAMRRLANVDIVGTAKFVVANADLVDEDADQIAAILRDRHEIAQGEKETFRIFSSKFAGKAAIKAKRMLGVYVSLAATLVLLVAAAVIASIMLVIVRERTGEIGLRKALGATPGAIVVQFLCESTIVALISGLLGVGLGLGVASAIADQYRIPMELAATSVFFALLVSVVVGIASGLIPARRAARLDPVQALR